MANIKSADEVKTVIIVLNYNDYKTCLKFVAETKGYEVFDRVILVDNCSTDDSVRFLNPVVDGRVELVQSIENKGYAYGNNVGMKYAVKKYANLETLIISNPDIHISESDVERILVPLKSEYGMSTGLIYNYNPQNESKTLASNFGWRVPSYGDMLSNCFLLAYKIKRVVFKNSMYLDYNNAKDQELIPVECVPGCFFALSVSAAKKIDYMDEGTFLFGEETILGKRLKDADFKACIVNKTTVLHENSVSINKSVKNSKIKANYRLQSEMLYLKNYLCCSSFKLSIYKALYELGLAEKKLTQNLIGKFHNQRC